MIYVTGDCHGEFKKFTTSAFPEQKEMTKDDIDIICGDFGGIWDESGESSLQKAGLPAPGPLPHKYRQYNCG